MQSTSKKIHFILLSQHSMNVENNPATNKTQRTTFQFHLKGPESMPVSGLFWQHKGDRNNIWQVGFNVVAERYLLNSNSNNHLSEKAFPMEFSAD